MLNKKYIAAAALLSLMCCAAAGYAADLSRDLKDSIIRMHIIAQSDSESDQSVKLEVRDAVLDAVRDIDGGNISLIAETAQNTANKYLAEHNIPYRAKTQTGIFEFPRKSYKNITLPAGGYRGVRIILGEGLGKNWWCIMYPPLCVTDDNSVKADGAALKKLRASLRQDTYSVITQDSKKPRVSLKIAELFGS